MFGAQKDNKLTASDLRNWMKRIVQFANDNNLCSGVSFVECDCQKLMGPELAWQLRKEMKELMQGREIINVFHLEDGADGFDRLVEFSDYIAISVPELRFNRGRDYKKITATLSKRARLLKPSIKIHLLGCTETDMLKQNKFVTSADSSSWTAPVRFGGISGHHVKQIKQDIIENAFDIVQLQASQLGFPTLKPNERNVRYVGTSYISANIERAKYSKACGPQD